MRVSKTSVLLAVLAGGMALNGCAGNMAKGVSTYDYRHNADGSTTAHIESVNEIKSLSMKINRDTGYLEVEVGDMTKRDDVVAVAKSFENVTTNLAGTFSPLLKAAVPLLSPIK